MNNTTVSSIKTIIAKLYCDEYSHKSVVLNSSANSVINYEAYEVYRNDTKQILKKSKTMKSKLTVITTNELYRELNILNVLAKQNPLPNVRIITKYLLPRLCIELSLKLYDLTNLRTKKVHQLIVSD